MKLKDIKRSPATVVAIIAIAVLESLAIFRGIDGMMFGLVIAAIAGLGGYSLREILGRK